VLKVRLPSKVKTNFKNNPVENKGEEIDAL
jgi:hypothetical protein